MEWKNYFQKGIKEYQKQCKSIKEFCYMEDSNLQFRQKMEDFHVSQDNFVTETQGLFGIFDGHGGQEVAKFVSEKLPQIFKKELQSQQNIENAIKLTFSKLDAQVRMNGAGDVGSTACLIFTTKENNEQANVGDTRALLVNQSSHQRLSYDHKASDSDEQQRIKSKGGEILKDRVQGTLAITRAFGDFNMKTKGVTSEPTIKKITVSKGSIILIASDGIWDVIEDQQAYEMTHKLNTTEDICKCLIYTSLNLGSKDNISCLAIKY